MSEESTREQRLAEILRRWIKATDGEWQTRFIFRLLQCARMHYNEGHLLIDEPEEKDWPNADFMAQAHQDIPFLMNELSATEAIEREKCCRDICFHCRQGDPLVELGPAHTKAGQPFWHRPGPKAHAVRCDASSIRMRAQQEEHELAATQATRTETAG